MFFRWTSFFLPPSRHCRHGPDEAFARKLYDALRAHKVVVFFFPETATVGERLDNEVFRQIQEHDRVLLVCSRDSLNRPGVVNEIRETLDREARDGGATYLLPIMLDDYVLTGWPASHPELAERVGRRIIGDFRGIKRSRRAFDKALARVVDALKVEAPLFHGCACSLVAEAPLFHGCACVTERDQKQSQEQRQRQRTGVSAPHGREVCLESRRELEGANL
jgi:hypothetical protein